MSIWLTNAQAIQEEVVEPFVSVVWQIRSWNGKAILYGDDRALFIFDPEEMKLHAIFENTYLCHTITSIQSGDAIANHKFHVRMATMAEIVPYASVESKVKKRIQSLTRTCLRSTHWLHKQEQN